MKILLLLLPLLLYSEDTIDNNETESFITDYEYGEMLYSNPRGVSCAECHGSAGEGKIISHYQDIHGKQEIKGDDIRKSTLEEMIQSVSLYHKVMPRYYLTNEEVKAIYDYLQKKNEAYLNTNK